MLPEWFAAIGTDRYLAPTEVPQEGIPVAQVWNAWRLYTNEFDGFCESRLDPLFNRLAHPAQWTGTLEPHDDASVLVLGTGPSARRGLPAVIRQRKRFWIFTSPRGAELLAEHGLTADLVLVEHRTALDAHHTARHVEAAAALRQAPLVATDWRTPARLLDGLSPDSVFVPDPMPTWGLWPATAVALAINARASRIGLLGIDLGTAQTPDPAHAPLVHLLGLLARLTTAAAIDCGSGGAAKPRWLPGSVEALASASLLAPPQVARRQAVPASARRRDAQAALAKIGTRLETARAILTDGLACRAGRTVHVNRLEAHATELLSWSADEKLRVAIQEGLGCSFLPRLWRTGIDLSLGGALWRPLVLGAHELVGQAERLQRAVGAYAEPSLQPLRAAS
jgi:hypothetical protein